MKTASKQAVLAPQFSQEGTPQMFDARLQTWLTSQHVAKIG